MEMVIRVNGVDQKVQAEVIKGLLWVHHCGQTFTVDISSGSRRRKKSAGSASDQVAAPMPGKVTKLLVKTGDLVEKGQAVLVMEAMKMEYTLKSEIAGQVMEIDCAVGEQVTLGKVLAKFKPKSES